MNSKERAYEELRSIIETQFPDLSTKEYEFLESGWDNYVIITDRKLAFKIPRDQGGVESLRKEVELTRCIRDCPVPVPEFAYVSDSGKDYVAGYRYIEGMSLNSVSTLHRNVRKQLSDFMNFLYNKSGERCVAEILGPASEDKWADAYIEYRETIFSSLYDVLDDATLSILAEKFEEFNANLSTLAVSLIHGDLYRGNVLIDENGNKLNGVIDWGTACFGDPAIDFAALSVDFGFDEIENIMADYTGRVDRNFRKRLEFYWQLEPTYGILYFRDKDTESHEQLRNELSRRLREGLYS